MKKWHKEAYKLYKEGMDIKFIAEKLKKSYNSVYMAIKRYPEIERKLPKAEIYYKQFKEKGLIDTILNLLSQNFERKGKKYGSSVRKLYLGLKPRLEMEGMKICKSRFYELVKYVIYKETGIENFNNAIHETPTKNRANKGTIKRQLDTLEIDVTGITVKNTLYFVILARDDATSYLLEPHIIEARDRNSKYYNTAINSIDVAKYFRDLFIKYGVPRQIKVDNEDTLSAEIVKRAFSILGIKIVKTKPYNPQQKLIERVIRSIKDNLSLFKNEDPVNAILSAIDMWNKEEHNFKVYQKPIVPAQLFQGYEMVDEEVIRKAFRERFERTLRDNTIKIDNLAYEIMFPETKLGDVYGRDTSVRKVIVYRDIENITILDVYDVSESTYLGVARLVSQTELLDSISQRQEKQREKRIQKREQKLKTELLQIEESKKKQEQIEQININDLIITKEEEKKQPEETDTLPDILELFKN